MFIVFSETINVDQENNKVNAQSTSSNGGSRGGGFCGWGSAVGVLRSGFCGNPPNWANVLLETICMYMCNCICISDSVYSVLFKLNWNPL